MPITPQQKAALEEIIHAILTATPPKRSRQLAEMFLELVDRTDWGHYYEVIPEPRCLNNIKASVEKGRYKDVKDAYTDLSLVFWNALFYNEPGSQISNDAETLKTLLETEWRKRPILNAVPRSSPPPSAPQKVHKMIEEEKPKPPTPKPIARQTSIKPATPIAAPSPLPNLASKSRMITPAPIASTSHQGQHRQSTPEIDVDGMSPDAESSMEDVPIMERDPLSEEIAKQLERGLPRWPGFGDKGWMEYATPDRMAEIVHIIKSHKDVVGNRLGSAFDSVPEESAIPNLSSTAPVSFRLIETRIRENGYSSAKEFDLDMARLFEKGRRWHEAQSEPYSRILLLQRLYQALTSPNPPHSPYVSTTNFAGLIAGPGSVKPVHGADSEGVPNVTMHRVLSKDRQFVDELHYKGWTVKLADWVHLSNPDDPSRPIIGQIFRCWVSEEPAKKGQQGVTVSWYYRPEQTYHPANRSFWEGEVFKTSHFADHPIEDLIEKIACQFTARHVRGRPRPPFWYVGWPLYVCDSRYNDRERIFVKIKNWNSCVPEEVRKSLEFMPIYPFERMVYPARLSSPFLLMKQHGATNVKMTGGLLPSTEGVPNPADGDKRARKDVGAARVAYPVIPASTQQQQQYYPVYAQQNQAAAAQHYQQQYQQQQLLQGQQQARGPDRSIITAAGGLHAIGGAGQVIKLPSETAKHFDRDPETNQVLWFASAPVDMAKPRKPKHSLEYLNFVANKKRKQEQQTEGGEGRRDGMEVDGNSTLVKPTAAPLTVSEMMEKLAKEMFGNSASPTTA
ncbi:hypothetical protein MD484_g8004, partial [Candolleomyces efflorescens]